MLEVTIHLLHAQVWDLLAPGGKQELELVKSIGGFDIPDLTQIGEALALAPSCPAPSEVICFACLSPPQEQH